MVRCYKFEPLYANYILDPIDSIEEQKDGLYDLVFHKEKLVEDIHVLITTSVLGNGVDLTGIDRIVVSDMSKIQCLQMVGRARTKGNDGLKR